MWYLVFQVVYELPTSNQWSFDIAWCPRNPAVISSASFDGHISVYSLMGGGQRPTLASRDKVGKKQISFFFEVPRYV